MKISKFFSNNLRVSTKNISRHESVEGSQFVWDMFNKKFTSKKCILFKNTKNSLIDTLFFVWLKVISNKLKIVEIDRLSPTDEFWWSNNQNFNKMEYGHYYNDITKWNRARTHYWQLFWISVHSSNRST